MNKQINVKLYVYNKKKFTYNLLEILKMFNEKVFIVCMYKIYINHTALMAHIFLYAGMRSFMLIQVLLAQECFIAMTALERTRS